MTSTLIFKFRNNLYINSYSELLERLTVPDRYADTLKIYFAQAAQSAGPEDSSKQNQTITNFIALLDKIAPSIGKPQYVFWNNSIDFFNKVNQQIIKHKEVQSTKWPNLPNFYLWFEWRIDAEHSFMKEIELFLDQFEAFLPEVSSPLDALPGPPTHWADDLEKANHNYPLLDYMYFHEEGHETCHDYTTQPNQEYFATMNIPSSNAINLDKTWIGILEKNSWDNTHSEFIQNIDRMKVVDLPPNSRPSYEQHLTNHATKTLGILMADNTPDCRGIVPAANVVISPISFFDNSEYQAYTALMERLSHLHEGFAQVILIEYSAPNEFPLIILPLMTHLTELAAQLGIITVVAAGNKNGSRELVNTGRMRRTIRKVLRKKEGLKGLRYWNKRLQADELIFNTNAPYILVGAVSQNPVHGHYCVYSDTNYGQGIVPVYAQGESVKTTDSDGQYTTMGYTSAAAAIMAGVVALLQGYAQEKLGRSLTLAEMKTVLLQGSPVYKEPRQEGDYPCGGVPNAELAMQQIDALANSAT